MRDICLISRDAGHLRKMRDCPAECGTVDTYGIGRAFFVGRLLSENTPAKSTMVATRSVKVWAPFVQRTSRDLQYIENRLMYTCTVAILRVTIPDELILVYYVLKILTIPTCTQSDDTLFHSL